VYDWPVVGTPPTPSTCAWLERRSMELVSILSTFNRQLAFQAWASLM
jgi:hypothetical protein